MNFLYQCVSWIRLLLNALINILCFNLKIFYHLLSAPVHLSIIKKHITELNILFMMLFIILYPILVILLTLIFQYSNILYSPYISTLNSFSPWNQSMFFSPIMSGLIMLPFFQAYIRKNISTDAFDHSIDFAQHLTPMMRSIMIISLFYVLLGHVLTHIALSIYKNHNIMSWNMDHSLLVCAIIYGLAFGFTVSLISFYQIKNEKQNNNMGTKRNIWYYIISYLIILLLHIMIMNLYLIYQY